MFASALEPLIAVDIGNQRLKFGRFDAAAAGGLPAPARVWHVGEDDELAALDGALGVAPERAIGWWIGSVNRPATTRLLDWLRRNRPEDAVTLLAARDLRLEVAVARPDMVGIDRLLDAAGGQSAAHGGKAGGGSGRGIGDHGRSGVGADGSFRGGRDPAGHRHVGPGAARRSPICCRWSMMRSWPRRRRLWARRRWRR